MRNAFSTYHPAVNFIFFIAVIGFAVFVMNPVLQITALTAALAYAVMLKGRVMVKLFALGMIPLIMIVTAVNMLTNHRGETVLFYTKYSQITAESMVYGALTGILMVTVMVWFICFGKVMTGEKLMYLFGRMTPAAAMIFTMVMRFIPSYRKQIEKISAAQKGMGRSVTDGTLRARVRHGMKTVSIMLTWALENSVETADSMRARGYGLSGRSTFSLYRFDGRDALALVYVLLMAAAVAAGLTSGLGSMEFYPRTEMAEGGAAGVLVYAAYAFLCFMPAMMQMKEVIVWKYLRSRI